MVGVCVCVCLCVGVVVCNSGSYEHYVSSHKIKTIRFNYTISNNLLSNLVPPYHHLAWIHVQCQQISKIDVYDFFLSFPLFFFFWLRIQQIIPLCQTVFIYSLDSLLSRFFIPTDTSRLESIIFPFFTCTKIFSNLLSVVHISIEFAMCVCHSIE